METRNYICDGSTFAYSRGYIGLPVDINGLPETIDLEGDVLHRKSTFHVSLVCVKNILEKLPDAEQDIIDTFCEFAKDNDVSFIKYTGEFRVAEDGERKTLIALCEINNLTTFSDHLATKLGIEVPHQPTHVTLHTLQPDLGIGLNSAEEMEQKSHQVDVLDLVSETVLR